MTRSRDKADARPLDRARVAPNAQHAERVAVRPEALPADRRPGPGPISVLPTGRLFQGEGVLEAEGAVIIPFGPDTRGIIATDARDVDGLVRALDANPRVSWVQLPYAGIDNAAPRLRPYAERGVLFTAAKGSYAQPVAEHALALTLATMRQLPMRARATSWGPKGGRSLYGANVLLLGAGGIALEFIDLMRPFDVSVTVGRRTAETPVPGADRTVDLDGFRAAIPAADVIMLAAPSTGETRHVIGAAELDAMKPSAVLVNIARGALIDTDALIRALDAEAIWGVGVDVTDPEPLPDGHPLYSHPRAVVTPHTADTPEMTQPLFVERCRANVEAFLRSGRFVGIADPILGY